MRTRSPSPIWTPTMRRRTFLSALGASLLLPRTTRAYPTTPERKFLFVFCEGGWDTLKCFTPKVDAPYIEDDGHTEVASVNGITYGRSDLRPNVDTFFQGYGDRVCVINGIEVSSITHERCRRIAMTGAGAAGHDDWASILAGNATGPDVLLPHVVISGPAFTQQYTSRVVRAGGSQLPLLLDGDVLPDPPTGQTEALEDAFVLSRLESAAAKAEDPRQRRFLEAYLEAFEARTRLEAEESLTFAVEGEGCNPDLAMLAGKVLDTFERGLSRCAILANKGVCDVTWDSHTDVDEQDAHYDLLFGYLSAIAADLDGRTGQSGAPLSEEVTVVVMSEMARDPRVNDSGGRDHWTYTSAMLFGAGVRGGQVIGGVTDDFLGESIDLTSGEITEDGVALVPKHLGATLLALGGLDPADFVTGADPILAALAD